MEKLCCHFRFVKRNLFQKSGVSYVLGICFNFLLRQYFSIHPNWIFLRLLKQYKKKSILMVDSPALLPRASSVFPGKSSLQQREQQRKLMYKYLVFFTDLSAEKSKRNDQHEQCARWPWEISQFNIIPFICHTNHFIIISKIFLCMNLPKLHLNFSSLVVAKA